MRLDMSVPVLVVDDVHTMTRLIRILLRQIGFSNTIGTRNDGKGAPFTGRDFREPVRSNSVHPRAPFVMITAKSKAATVINATKAGVDSYIVKPFNAAVLNAKISAVFRATDP